jgi:Leucine-rich repeat (LRR) protein
MEVFEINRYLKLKLENGKTNIYIKNELFLQCKSLLLDIPRDKIKELVSINSIDEVAEKLNCNRKEDFNNEIKPDEEFWAHCSNLQAWVEHNYDSRLLHSNLSFPLLKKLSEVGDLKAKTVFKEEIIYRFYHGTEIVQEYLLEEGYLDLVTDDERYSLIEPESDLKALKEIESQLGVKLKLDREDFNLMKGVVLKSGKIVGLKLCQCGINEIPKAVENLENLGKLVICSDTTIKEIPSWIGNLTTIKTMFIGGLDIKTLPESFGKLKSLEKLGLSGNNKLGILPESFGDLINLKYLDLTYNSLKTLPESFGSLSSLQSLDLNYKNVLTGLPESFGNLQSLEKLSIEKNQLNSLPESLGDLKSIRVLNLNNNNLDSLPDSIGNLNTLEHIDLNGNQFEEFPRCLIECRSLKGIYLSNNKIKEIPRKLIENKTVEVIGLRNNRIQIFPDFLDNMKSLKKLDVKHNPIKKEAIILHKKINILI